MQNDEQLITTILSYAILFSLISIISMWRIYRKAGQPGWAAIVPIYNLIVWLKIINKPTWWIVLLFIPVVNIVISIWMVNLLAKRFDRNVGFTLGLIFLGMFFYPLLAYKNYKYIGDIEVNSTFTGDSEDKQDKLLIWALGIFLFNAMFWLVFSNFVSDWWRFYYLHIPIGVLCLFAFFLVSLGVQYKYRTASIILSISVLIIYFVNNLLPLVRDLSQY